MVLRQAVEADFGAVVELANLAYRGTGETESWNVEAGIIEGQRLNDAQLRADLLAKPDANLLVYRDELAGPLLGTVWLEPRPESAWYLGLLTVRPDLQNRQLGRALLVAAKDFVQKHHGRRVRISVLNVREALIAWYQRRGYELTGETEAFPYGDERFGKPLRDDLEFVMLEKIL